MSPADHCNLVFLLLPATVAHGRTLYLLAWSFFDNAKLLTDVDIRTFVQKRIQGTEKLCTSVMNMDSAD